MRYEEHSLGGRVDVRYGPGVGGGGGYGAALRGGAFHRRLCPCQRLDLYISPAVTIHQVISVGLTSRDRPAPSAVCAGLMVSDRYMMAMTLVQTAVTSKRVTKDGRSEPRLSEGGGDQSL